LPTHPGASPPPHPAFRPDAPAFCPARADAIDFDVVPQGRLKLAAGPTTPPAKLIVHRQPAGPTGRKWFENLKSGFFGGFTNRGRTRRVFAVWREKETAGFVTPLRNGKKAETSTIEYAGNES